MNPSHSRLRVAAPDDAVAVAALNDVVHGLHHRAHPDRFTAPGSAAVRDEVRQWLTSPGTCPWDPGQPERRCWIGERPDDGVPIGFVIAVACRRPAGAFKPAERWVELDQIAVVDEARNDGLGAKLVRTVFDWAGELHVDEVRLGVWAFNSTAQRFFASFGFAPLRTDYAASLA